MSVLGPVTPASQSSSFPGDISRGTGQDTRPVLVHPGCPATLVLGGLSPGRGFSSQVLALPAAPSLGLGSGAVSGYGVRIQEGSQSGPWSTEEVGRASDRGQVSAPPPGDSVHQAPPLTFDWHTPVLRVVRKWHQYHFNSREGGEPLPSCGGQWPGPSCTAEWTSHALVVFPA